MAKKIGLIVLGVFFLGACATSTVEPTALPVGPTPTVHPFFEPRTPAPFFPTIELSTPAPTIESTYPISETAIPLPFSILTTTIFDEDLNTHWAIETSPNMSLETDNSLSVHSGNSALTIGSQPGDSVLFRVRVESLAQYESINTLGLSFWIYSGEKGVRYDDLMVQVFGSDEVYYWVRNDRSAFIDLDTFSGTLLYGLGLNLDIPPDTWERIEIPLDALVYDPNFDNKPVEFPDFSYITGFSIHFGKAFEGTIAIDDVNLLTWVGE